MARDSTPARGAAPTLVACLLAACGADPNWPAGASASRAEGRRLYEEHCLVCHQQDGRGVPGMQPALRDSTVVAGDAARLVDIVLRGSDALASSSYQNTMPGFAKLQDAEIAAILTYLRTDFGDRASALDPAEVAASRSRAGNSPRM